MRRRLTILYKIGLEATSYCHFPRTVLVQVYKGVNVNGKLWVRFRLEEIKYLMFSFARSGTGTEVP